jgi:hypothetical protein
VESGRNGIVLAEPSAGEIERSLRQFITVDPGSRRAMGRISLEIVEGGSQHEAVARSLIESTFLLLPPAEVAYQQKP